MISEQRDCGRNAPLFQVKPTEFFLNMSTRANRYRFTKVFFRSIDAADQQLAPPRRQEGCNAIRAQLQRPRDESFRRPPFSTCDLGFGLLGECVSPDAVPIKNIGYALALDRLREVPHGLEPQLRRWMRRVQQHLLHPARQTIWDKRMRNSGLDSFLGIEILEGMAAFEGLEQREAQSVDVYSWVCPRNAFSQKHLRWQ